MMDNRANNTAKPDTDNTADLANNETNWFSDSRLVTAAIFAFLPYFGIFGVHDFILKRYKKGIIHVIIAVVCFALSILFSASCKENVACNNLLPLISILRCVEIALYIWAVVEGIQILLLKNQNVMSSQKLSNQNTIQPPNPVMNTGYNYGVNNVSDRPSAAIITKVEEEKNQDHKAWSVVSFITTLIPIFLWISCLTSSGGSLNEGGAGAVWWVVGMYYMSLGLPIEILSIVSGIQGLKTSYRSLAVFSLRLKVIMFAVIVAIMFIQSFIH